MSLYAESSAVLAWLLGEPPAAAVARRLEAEDRILASELTLVECDRVLLRAVSTGAVPEARAVDRRALLEREAVHWHRLAFAPEVVERARRPFPDEPLRTLDAFHLAFALLGRSALPDLAVLSLDARVRRSARGLGFEVLPEEADLARNT